jgi:hypothetical protein
MRGIITPQTKTCPWGPRTTGRPFSCLIRMGRGFAALIDFQKWDELVRHG